MPRTLPWLTDGASRKTARSSAQVQPPKRNSSPSPDLVNSDLDLINATPSPKRKRFTREPSSSPPPIINRPKVEYMKDGFGPGGDDIHMMVEDEFEATARLFTQHIHHAEYERLKRLHKSRGVRTLEKVPRPTDGRTVASREVKLQMDARERAQRQKDAGLREEDEDESDENDEYMEDPQLAGLMTGSQQVRPVRDLGGFAKARGPTRAAAGYSQSPHKGDKRTDALAESSGKRGAANYSTSEDEYDGTEADESDLDLPFKKPAAPAVHNTEQKARESSKTSPEAEPEMTGFFKQFSKPREEQKKPIAKDLPRPSRAPSPEKKVSPPFVREPSRQPTPVHAASQSKGGKGSRIAAMMARRSEAPEQRTERPALSQVKLERKIEVKIEQAPPARSKKKSSTIAQANGATSRYLTSRKEIKREEDQKSAPLDDIPTFLF